MDYQLRKLLLEGLKQLFKPVARFCLNRSMKIQDAAEMLKFAFLEVAKEELQRDGKLISNSRLSVMTGLHRRDVVRLLLDGQEVHETAPLLLRVVGQWQQDPRFTDKKKTPKPLSIEGKKSQFVNLVQSVSKDLNPYTVLFELERVGAVRREGDEIVLNADVYVPDGDIKESLGLLGRDVEDLILAVDDNVFKKPSIPHLHIKTRYDNVCLSAVPELRKWCLELGARVHAEVRAKLAKYDKDVNPKLGDEPGGAVVSFGTFARVYRAPLNVNPVSIDLETEFVQAAERRN